MQLAEAAEKQGEMPQLKLGAEVYYFNGIGSWEGLCDLAIEGTDYVLVEMPFAKWSDRMYDELDGIYRNLGLVPIIAHIDRYINVFTAKKVMERLSELKVAIQANAEFFNDRKTRSLALKLLKNSDINILGSDCHNLTERQPNLAVAEEIILEKLGQEAINSINLAENMILPAVK